MEKPQMAAQIIRDTLAQHQVQVEQIFLFGSHARDEAGPESDWDFYVLVACDLTFARRHRLITEIKRKLARLRIPNDVILKSAEQFRRTRMYPGHLAYDVAREGVTIL